MQCGLLEGFLDRRSGAVQGGRGALVRSMGHFPPRPRAASLGQSSLETVDTPAWSSLHGGPQLCYLLNSPGTLKRKTLMPRESKSSQPPHLGTL